MKKITFLLLIVTLFNTNLVKGQTNQKEESNSEIEKAEYLKGNLTEVIQRNLEYPLDAVQNNIEGDIILSFVIKKDGIADSLTVINSTDESLSESSVIAFNSLENTWQPC